jgi:hypothetical protein
LHPNGLPLAIFNRFSFAFAFNGARIIIPGTQRLFAAGF